MPGDPFLHDTPEAALAAAAYQTWREASYPIVPWPREIFAAILANLNDWTLVPTDALDALNAAIDDTHPEGCGCDICHAADAIAVASGYPEDPRT